MAVHFCPAFAVISFLTSLIKISHSGFSGVTSSPRTIQFKESASKLKGTFSFKIVGCAFSFNPVEAEPVNVITSCEVTWSKRSPTPPQSNCNAPSGKIFELIISVTTTCVK